MARLAQGIRKRANGTFEKRFTIAGQRYSIYGNTTKELTEKEQELRKQIEQGTYKHGRKITLDDYFKKWIERRKIHNKGNSLKTYISIYDNHISKRLGKYKIAEITREMILDMQADLAKEYTPVTTNYVITVIRAILNDATTDDIISINPASRIKSIRNEKKAIDSYHRALTEKEQALFMQEIKDSYYYELFALALSTGMRFGEICALTWGDIDYVNNVIHVTETQTRDIDGKITKGSPKTSAGKRDIPITPSIRQALKMQREKMGNIYRLDMQESPIFVSIYGKTIHNTAINNEIDKALDNLEQKGHSIEHFTFHALRDTFATRYIEQGGQMQTLKKILGHKSLQMTMDLYAHVLPDTMQDEMQKIVINI